MEEEIKKRNAVSFGFTKRLESKKLEKSVVGETSNILNEDSEQTDFVTSLEGKKINSTIPKQEVKKEFIIPLINENRWRYEQNGEKGTDLQSKAVQEILETAAQQNQEWEDRDKPDPNLTVPLLMRNKVPNGFEMDDNLNVSLRPDEPMEVNYESIPIEQFGFAMLRGMGWKEGEGLGKDKSVIDPVNAVLRPKGLGLGADKRQHAKNEIKGCDENNEESLTYKKGAFCVLTKGPQKDFYGIIEGIDEDNARVMVKLALSGHTATLSQYGIQLVGQKEYEKYSKYLNKSKVEKYKQENECKLKSTSSHRSKNYNDSDDIENVNGNSDDEARTRKRKSNHDERNSHGHSSKHDKHRSKHSKKSKKYHHDDHHESDSSRPSRYGTESDSEKRRKHRRDQKYTTSSDEHDSRNSKQLKKERSQKHSSEIRGNEFGTSSPSSKDDKCQAISAQQELVSARNKIWMCPNMKVRIVDKHFKNGKYFKSKVVIIDVISKNNCICKTEGGQILENLSQDHLETVIPRETGDQRAIVMLTATSQKGRIGEIISRNKTKSQLVVRLLCSGYEDENIVTLDSYDHACEFVGLLEDELH
ncbi:G-patch domain and KOW motifs-containing protein-like [Gigantopelta aegis]|uniref:G-patch domain and KOW motifs-containing protein-like n=1 Tax=Gigantopelta aegis TaxID=1735272 RepID=UPI001B8894C4|nr:G-patch domain and KOW motifs-containing protein-like [Gigantopelta aegis]